MQQGTCAICGPSKTAVLARKGIFEKGGPVIEFTNVICKKCGLVYRNPRPDEAELAGIYKKKYLEERHSMRDEESAFLFADRVDQKNKGEQIADVLKDFLDKNSRVLDVGAGLGLVGGYLKEYLGCHVEGIEPSELSARVAAKKYGLKIFVGTFDEFLRHRSSSERFDCVLLHHVFEHFGDPLRKLEELAGLLNPRGILYMEVPDVLNFNKPMSQFFDFLHLYNYSPATLLHILSLSGFKIIRWNREKSFRLQVIAARNTHPLPAVAVEEKIGPQLARKTIRYCRGKYALELLYRACSPFQRLKRTFKI